MLTVARQTPLSVGFFRQEHWSGSPYPPPGDLPEPGIEPMHLLSPALAGGFFTTSATWEARAILGPTYKWYYMVSVFLFLTHFTYNESLQSHLCCCKLVYIKVMFSHLQRKTSLFRPKLLDLFSSGENIWKKNRGGRFPLLSLHSSPSQFVESPGAESCLC